MKIREIIIALFIFAPHISLYAKDRITLVFPGVFCQTNDLELCEEINTALVKAIKKEHKYRLLYGRSLKGKIDSTEEELIEKVFLSRLKTYIEEGKLHYKMASFDMAISTFEKGEAYLLSIIPFLERKSELIELKLYSALSFIGKGDEKQARNKLRELLILDPSFRMNPVQFPPWIMETFETVRREVMALPSGIVKVSSSIDGGDVYLDGKRRGRAPLTIKDVLPGDHYILVKKEKGGRGFKTFNLAPSTTEDITVTLYPPEFFIEGMVEPEFLKELLSSFMKSIEGRPDLLILLLIDSKPSIRIQLFDTEYELLSKGVGTSLKGVKEIASILDILYSRFSSYIDENGRIKSDTGAIGILPLNLSKNREFMSLFFSSTWTEGLRPEQKKGGNFISTVMGKGPLYKRWWFWTGAGILAGGTGGGLYLLVDYWTNPEGSITINF